MARFAIRFGAWRPVLSVAGMGPSRSWVDVDAEVLTVRMGWAFVLRVPRPRVGRVAARAEKVVPVGVHCSGGRWIVNGATTGIVEIDFDRKERCRSYGLPARCRRLYVAVEDPEALVAALRR